MYNDFFHFKEKPFALEPSARFIVLSQDHREALATLVYAIDEQEGWALLLGQPGVGKTTLIIALLKELGERVIPAVVTNPRVSPLDFMNMMALELGLPGPYQTKGQFLVALNDLIKRSRREGKVVLLVVDEAHSLLPEMIEELRLLGNLDDSSPRVLNIFLVGQPELLKVLKGSDSVSLLQRLRRYHLLKPLSQEETYNYVRHRLTVAGGDPELFNDQALEAVYRLSRGVPRLINSVCDDALLMAFTREQSQVDLSLVVAGAKDDPTLRWTFGEPELLTQGQGPAPSPLSAPQARPAASEGPSQDTAPATWAAPRPAAQAQAPPPAQPSPGQAGQSPGQAPAEAKPSRAQRKAQFRAEKARRRAEKKMRRAQQTQTRAQAKTRAQPQAPAPPTGKRGVLSRLAGGMSKNAPGSFWKRLVALALVVAVIWGLYLFYKHVGRQWAVRLGLLPPAILMPAEIPKSLGEAPAKAQDQGPPDWGPLLHVDTGSPSAPGGGHG